MANRFENDPLGQPRADSRAVSTSLIIPHTDGGYLLLSLTQRSGQSQICYVCFFCFFLQRRPTRGRENHRAVSLFILGTGQPDVGGLSSQISAGTSMDEKAAAGRSDSGGAGGRVARILFMACGRTAGCLGSPGNSHTPPFVFHHRPPRDTFSFTRRRGGCKNTF